MPGSHPRDFSDSRSLLVRVTSQQKVMMGVAWLCNLTQPTHLFALVLDTKSPTARPGRLPQWSPGLVALAAAQYHS